MQIVNINEVEEASWSSPTGKFGGFGRGITDALGLDSDSMDTTKRPPFDLELARLAPGQVQCPYHWHSAQWEFYIVVSGCASVRHKDGVTEVGAGCAFVFPPFEAHSISNTGTTDLIYYIVADNPMNETCYYPDSNKWSLPNGERRIMLKGEPVKYYAGEDDLPSG